MAVAPRPPGDYAPAAGSRAVEAVHEAGARPARRADPARDGGRIPGRIPHLLGGLLSIEAGAGVSVEWRVLFGDAEVRRVAGALRGGSARWRERHRGLGLARLHGGLRTRGAGARRRPRPGGAARPGRARPRPGLRGAGSLEVPHERGRSRRRSALARVRRWWPPAISSWCPTGPSCRRHSRTTRSREAPPGIDPLDSAQPRARAAPAGPGGAPAGRGPRPAVLPPVARARPLGRSARRDRVLPARRGGGAGPPARAGRELDRP